MLASWLLSQGERKTRMKRCLLLVLAVPLVAASPALAKPTAPKVSCTYSSGVLTVHSPNGAFAQVNRSGDAIVISDFLEPPIACAGGSPTILNTDRVVLRHTGFSSTDINLTGGPFAPGATLEPDGSSEIEFEFADDGLVQVNGTAAADVLTWGAGEGLNLNFNQNGDRDVDVSHDAFSDGFIVANGAAGPDLINAQSDYTGFGVFSQGGRGNDVLIAPRQGGILDGGPGRDTIRGGGFDLISGGRGRDRILAGKGSDEIAAVDGTKDRVSCGRGPDVVKADRADKLKGCENVSRVGKGAASSAAAQPHGLRSRMDRLLARQATARDPIAGAPSARAATPPAAANLHDDASTYGSLGDREATARDHLCTDPGTGCAFSPRELYIVHADPICLTNLEAQNRATRGVVSDVKKGSFKKAARKFRRAGSIFAGGIDQLAALTPPAADSSLIASWIESLRVQVPIVNKFAKALAKHKRLRMLNLVGQWQRASDHSQGLVGAYGFQVCNQF